MANDRQTLRESVADDLGIRATATIGGTPTSTHVSVPGLRNFFEREEPVVGAFAQIRNKASGWRKVDSWDAVTDLLTVETAWSVTPVSGDTLEIYQHLTPDEINAAIDTAHSLLYFEDRISTALVADQNLYSFASSTWLKRKGQVISVLLRGTYAGKIQEIPPGGYDLIEEDDAVSLWLHQVPTDVTDISLVVVARHYYEPFASDAATTTCPWQLLKAQVAVEVIQRIWSVIGSEKAKQLFGMELALTEKRLNELKQRWLPKLDARDVVPAEPRVGPEFAIYPSEWEW